MTISAPYHKYLYTGMPAQRRPGSRWSVVDAEMQMMCRVLVEPSTLLPQSRTKILRVAPRQVETRGRRHRPLAATQDKSGRFGTKRPLF